MENAHSNWAGNYTFGAARWHWPTTVAEVQDVVRGSRKLRVLGSRHSFNAVADSLEDIVSLERFDEQVVIDRERLTVTVNAGLRYGRLGQALYQAGYALHNLASLPHISVAGACATATHGSGDRNGNLATAVAALELVTPDGGLVVLSREQQPEPFYGAVVGLGALGVVTRVTLDISPAFDVRQDVYENLPLVQLDDHFDEITGSAYSVSLFTDWRGPRFNQVWLKQRVTDATADAAAEPDFFGASLATTRLHPIGALSADSCTEQLGRPGPWHERLPHFRLDFTPSSGAELQTEYLLPRQHALAAILAVAELREQVSPLLLISEVRTIAADNLWLSPCYQQACVALHFTWQPDWPAVRQLLPRIEARLAPLAARPHWGKLFTLPPAQVRAQYPQLPRFQQLLGEYDPSGKFRNAFVERYIFGAD
jgi:xylitol oxidase